MNGVSLSFLLALLLAALVTSCAAPWRARLDAALPELGHRNWIVVADGAYPAQTSPGIETVATGAEPHEVLAAVLAALDASTHVRPEIWLDRELELVSEADAPGIDAFRRELARTLEGRPVHRDELHEAVLHRLDAEGRLARVLVLKTRGSLPYTSVFLRLECGYWSAEAEARLRERMRGGG